MKRIFFLVEGQTEEKFVKEVLAEHFLALEITAKAIIVTTRRDQRTRRKLSKGGGHWKHWRRDLRRLLAEQVGSEARFTTLFDLYGLPDDFPELEAHSTTRNTVVRAQALEKAMSDDIGDHRFVPYLQRHEFEALVLAGLDHLEQLLDTTVDLDGLKRLRKELADIPPEDVDDGVETAPSGRLMRKLPSYQKALHGPLVTHAVGLAVLRAVCPRFAGWLLRLENLWTEGTT